MEGPPNTYRHARTTAGEFGGFHPLNANFLYCPNQFFDVCVANSSRGVIRCVAYVLRQTLGWLDKNGQPISEEIVIPYRDFIERAGISRGAVTGVLDEAVSAGYLVCVRRGTAKSVGVAGTSSSFRLRWAPQESAYHKSVEQFDGFFAGVGNRTPVPNEFFDLIVPRERASTIKVVGAILRHTIGYRTQFGHRSETELSFTALQRYTNLTDRSTVASAIQHAVERGFIERVSTGSFSSNPSSSSYAPRWRVATNSSIGSKTRPASQFKNPTGHTADQFRNQTGNEPETRPEDGFKNPTTSKDKTKDTHKQQPVAANSLVLQELTTIGFDQESAQRLADHYPANEIQQQIQWLDRRNPKQNKLGLLRKAIEQSWAEPPESDVTRIKRRERERREAERQKFADDNNDERAARSARREALLDLWSKLSNQERELYRRSAIAEEGSPSMRAILEGKSVDDRPPREFLDACARDRGLPPGTAPEASEPADEPRSVERTEE